MHVLLGQVDREAWNGFLRQQSYSHFWHSWEWGEFLASFKQREILRFSVHDKGGDVLGLSTVCIEPLPHFGKRGDSIPVWHLGGPVLQDSLDHEARKAVCQQLINVVDRELRERRALDMTFRVWDPFSDHTCFEPWLKAGYRMRERCTWMCTIPEDESQLMKTFAGNFRSRVKQGYRRGGVVEINITADIRELYELHKMSMVHGGTDPRYSLDEVSYALNWNNDLRDIYLCRHEGRLIGFLLSLKFNRVTLAWLSGMNRSHSEIRPMNLMFHELIRNSARQKMRTVDLGGGVTKGATHFKEGAGAKPTSTFNLSKVYCSRPYLMLARGCAAGPEKLVRKAVFALLEGRFGHG